MLRQLVRRIESYSPPGRTRDSVQSCRSIHTRRATGEKVSARGRTPPPLWSMGSGWRTMSKMRHHGRPMDGQREKSSPAARTRVLEKLSGQRPPGPTAAVDVNWLMDGISKNGPMAPPWQCLNQAPVVRRHHVGD
jgi:hypothetical protein